MHLGNGVVTPMCAVVGGGMAVAGFGLCALLARAAGLDKKKVMGAGAMGGVVLAAQALNIPVMSGVSGHVIGGVLASWMLGPGLGAMVMGVVLAVQALVMGDGALATLGLNWLNMGLLPAACVWSMRRWGTGVHWTVQAGLCAFASVMLGAMLVVGEVSTFSAVFAREMISVHALIGLGEAVTTVAGIGILQAGMKEISLKRSLALAMLVLMLAPLSSRLPDGLEAAMARSGIVAK